MKQHKKDVIWLLLWVILLLSVSGFLGMVTQQNIATWYNTLKRSPLSPPNYLFGIVWPILYCMIGTSGWLMWQMPRYDGHAIIRYAYILQLVLNWLWTPLFFSYHFIGWSLFCLFLIVVTVMFLILRLYKLNRIAASLLLPYLAWLLFATHLHVYVWLYN
ncbi:tryptophan-rich sensory protein [bacterium]|nr:MAG: tryptophan-rich sensory protein [bacterium]QQR62194.1 MAG: tryptophan-rich sensory protein [bacterium]QQR63248.1 MAG: tryptophan-rich sensory protein [bacterium]